MSTALQKLTALAVKSALWWLKRYAPAAVPTKYAPYHQHLAVWPEPGHAQARVLYRAAAKTTVTRGLILHTAQRNKARGILVIRATYSDCDGDYNAIRDTARIAGCHVIEIGVQRLLVVNNVPIWFRTPGGAVRGLQWTNPGTGEPIRPDKLSVDDLETRSTASSQMQTTKIMQWLFSDAMQTADPAHPMSTVMSGTPITPNCLIAQAMRQSEPFDTWDTPLVVPIVDTDGNPAWPDNFNPEWATHIPEITWATEYMLDPLPPGTLLFPPAHTRWDNLPASKVHEVIIAVDPAGDGEDATVAVAMCMTPRGLHIIDCLHHTGTMENAPGEVARFVRGLQAEGWLIIGAQVEGVGAWEFFRRELAKLLAPVRVAADVPNVSKVERALPLTVWHRVGALSVDERLKGSQWDLEFHSFQQDGQTITGHDDCTDATAWAAQQRTRNWRADPPHKADAHSYATTSRGL